MRQLLAAVGVCEAAGCGLDEAEVAVEGAHRVGARRARSRSKRAVQGHQDLLCEQGARVGAVDRRVAGGVERGVAVELR
jgi:hypothetical protein